MEAEIINKTYELAYHLNPDVEEAEVGRHTQELQSLITQNSGSILASKEPKQKHLSYPLKQKHYAYFGTFDFSVSPENISKINSEIKLQNNILRYLLIQKSDKDLRTLGSVRIRSKIKTHQPVSREGLEQVNKGTENIKPEEMEKEIEEVLEKL